MKAYSADLRQRVPADCDEGMPAAEAGSIEPIPRRHGPRPKWEPHVAAIAEAVRQEPDATLEEHRAALGVDLGISS